MLNTIAWLENLDELQLEVDARQIVEQIKLENLKGIKMCKKFAHQRGVQVRTIKPHSTELPVNKPAPTGLPTNAPKATALPMNESQPSELSTNEPAPAELSEDEPKATIELPVNESQPSELPRSSQRKNQSPPSSQKAQSLCVQTTTRSLA